MMKIRILAALLMFFRKKSIFIFEQMLCVLSKTIPSRNSLLIIFKVIHMSSSVSFPLFFTDDVK